MVMNNEYDSVYAQALERLETELGWTETDARDAISSYASVRGVALEDIAEAILLAPTLNRGLGQALYGVLVSQGSYVSR
jgi:hypothetical protein